MIKDEAVGVKMEEMAAAAADGGGGNGTGGGVGGFDPMEEDPHIWLDREQENLLDVTDASIFYNDFPPLPDFPCMSSSSSSSSTPAVSRPGAVTSSSSSAVSSSPPDSWASLMKSDGEEMNFQHGEDREVVKLEPATLSSTASMEIPPPPSDLDGGLGDVDCLNVMETFGYMDLIDSNEIWDPSSVFQTENLNPQELFEDPAAAAAAAPPPEESHSFSSFLQENSELAMIFLEWLKQNKDYISAEDMRSIKLKRATIESASKRLGSDKEGKKQLLKLILEWVEQHQLQKKKTTADPNPNPSPNPNFSYTTPLPPDPNACFWAPPPPEVTPMMAAAPPPPPFPGYGCDPYSNQIPMVPMNHHHHVMPYQAVMDHNTPPQTWPVSSPYPMPQPQYMSPYPDNNGGMMTHQQAFYGNNSYSVFDPNGERLMRLGSSATKEARKKRMARQRRMYSHHHRHSSNSSQHQNQSNEDCNVGADGGEVDGDQAGSPGSWVYWSGGGGASSPTNGNAPPADVSQPHSGDRPPAQTHQRQASSDRRPQGWKSEKNLKFLLQKVLKQSDVGNLGRIVLPKKEAESHLPELETRDGISIAMEDIGTSRVWNMRYRFWPNNKSRMYLLENTGDFVRVNGLQEGDFIVIYSDTKCGKFMIRGVKVRQTGGKLEGKKPARRNMRNLSLAGSSSSLTPIKQAVR